MIDNMRYILKYTNEIEIKQLLFLVNNPSYNTNYFIDICAIIKCNNHYYCIFEVLMCDLEYILPTINNKYKFLYLLQALFAIYHFNHEIGLFHNDLYYENNIRNIMLYDTYFNTNLTHNKKNTISLNDIIIQIPTYGVKIIDFEWSDHQPQLRTLEYHNKYFIDVNHVSEILIFIYIYFKSFGIDLYENLIKKVNIIKHYDRKIFDYKLIQYIYIKYMKLKK